VIDNTPRWIKIGDALLGGWADETLSSR